MAGYQQAASAPRGQSTGMNMLWCAGYIQLRCAHATNPIPIAADRELTTRTAEPNSLTMPAAVLKVPDSAAEICTPTTPSPSLSSNAWR